MAVECAAVLIMLLAMSIVIRQKGNRGADLAMIPLYFMPAIYLAAGWLFIWNSYEKNLVTGFVKKLRS